MFRLAPYKNNSLTDAHVILIAAIGSKHNSQDPKEFFTLKTEISNINSLVLSWTVVHKIDEDSPFYGNIDDLMNDGEVELFIQIRAFDEGFANTVVQRTSYVTQEIINGAKFLPMFRPSENQQTTVLDLDKINLFEKVNLK